jgi:hypothetical protein
VLLAPATPWPWKTPGTTIRLLYRSLGRVVSVPVDDEGLSWTPFRPA